MKYEIIEKAWCINPDNLEELYFYDTDDIYYGTRGVAKSKILLANNNATLLSTGETVDFTNIRIKRKPKYDKILYKGKLIKRYDIEYFERLDRIASLPKNKFYYVQDRRSYVGNAVLWWAKNANGYVTDLKKAHKYTWDEIQVFKPRDTDIIWESEHVENAIREYVDAQGLDKEFSL